MFGHIGQWVNKVTARLTLDQTVSGQDLVPSLRESIDQAKRDWLCARAFFEQVTDPELVDYAIYHVKAAERRYMYLLGRARLDAEAISGLR